MDVFLSSAPDFPENDPLLRYFLFSPYKKNIRKCDGLGGVFRFPEENKKGILSLICGVENCIFDKSMLYDHSF